MPRWEAIEEAEPEFAARAKQLFVGRRHHTIATLHADGSPRISGIECEFVDGDLRFGSMPDSRKGADLTRDGRFALHSATTDPVQGKEREWPGEAKVAGRAIASGPIAAPEGYEDAPDGVAFLTDITEIAITHLNPEGTKLVVEWWTPARGLTVIERD